MILVFQSAFTITSHFYVLVKYVDTDVLKISAFCFVCSVWCVVSSSISLLSNVKRLVSSRYRSMSFHFLPAHLPTCSPFMLLHTATWPVGLAAVHCWCLPLTERKPKPVSWSFGMLSVLCGELEIRRSAHVLSCFAWPFIFIQWSVLSCISKPAVLFALFLL